MRFKTCAGFVFASMLTWHPTCQAQTLTISNGAGQSTSVTVIPPHLLSDGTLIMTLTNGSNCYAGRGLSGIALSTEPLPPSVLPMLLELDNQWYAITGGLLQSFMQPNLIELTSGSWRNCRRANGDALALNPTAPVLALGGSPSQRIALQPVPFLIQYLPGADSVRLRSRTGDVVCDGSVPGPVAPHTFASGFETP
jgi:hypothetical protein